MENTGAVGLSLIWAYSEDYIIDAQRKTWGRATRNWLSSYSMIIIICFTMQLGTEGHSQKFLCSYTVNHNLIVWNPCNAAGTRPVIRTRCCQSILVPFELTDIDWLKVYYYWYNYILEYSLARLVT